MTSGALFKIKPKFHRWISAFLREANKDSEGYYLKVDGNQENNNYTEQLYLYLTEEDVRCVVESWGKILAEEQK